VRQVLEADLSLIASAAPPVLIDEWQNLPEVWDKVRHQVDDGAATGRYVLDGDAYYSRLATAPKHYLADRGPGLGGNVLGLAQMLRQRDSATPNGLA
jgi:hypothetical protein